MMKRKYIVGYIMGPYKIIGYGNSKEKEVAILYCSECKKDRVANREQLLRLSKIDWSNHRLKCSCCFVRKGRNPTTVLDGSSKKSLKPHRSLLDGEFEKNVQIKSSLQKDDFYSTIKRYGVGGDSVVLPGPDITRHISDNRETFGIDGSTIYFVEKDPDVFQMQEERYAELKETWNDLSGNSHSFRDNVILFNGSILDAPNCPIIDADLMKSIIVDGPIVLSLLKRQAEAKDQYKAFIFTLSERGGKGLGYQKTMRWIENEIFSILGLQAKAIGKIPVSRDPKCNLIYKHKIMLDIENLGRVVDINMFHYNDLKSPMMTACLIYK